MFDQNDSEQKLKTFWNSIFDLFKCKLMVWRGIRVAKETLKKYRKLFLILAFSFRILNFLDMRTDILSLKQFPIFALDGLF